MTHNEDQRVVHALRAYTGGLTVTEHDIAVAEDRLKSTLEPPSPRRRLAVLAAAVAAVLVVGFFVARALEGDENSAPPADAPSSPAKALAQALQADAYTLSTEEFATGTAPSRQDMAGFWLLREPYFFSMFMSADGHWVLGSTTDQAGFGRSTLSGDKWTRHYDGGHCVEGAGRHAYSQTWQTTLTADGSLRMQLSAGPTDCTPAETREVWDRVAPESPLGDYLAAATKAADWQTAPRSFTWQGIYVSPETGRVLEVGADASFLLYDLAGDEGLEPIDRGALSYDGFKQQTTGVCDGATFSAAAEVAQLPAVEGYVGSLEAVRVSTSESCTSGLTSEAVWVKVA
jgi:hypothetical protein